MNLQIRLSRDNHIDALIPLVFLDVVLYVDNSNVVLIYSEFGNVFLLQ